MKSKAAGDGGQGLTRRRFLVGAGAGALAAQLSGAMAGESPTDAEASERRKVEAAIPVKAPATPLKRRRLLIFDLNVGYGGHPSARTANLAFSLMGSRTGAYETLVTRDVAVFRPESLKDFDAVFFNNTVGNLFEDAALRQSLLEFVYAGGGLMGVHGTSVAFTRWTEGAKEDWPEFGFMLGTRGAHHYSSTEHVFMKLDDPDHPVVRCFGGKGFDFRDEFFRPQDPYSRIRNRVLLSIDTDKTDLSAYPQDRRRRADNDYAVAWVRNYGRGRVFYCTIAHNPYVFWEAKMLEFYLAAAQFVLGDLPGPTVPSALLTPAIRAQERLGWRLGLEARTFGRHTFFEAVEKAAQLGIPYIGGLGSQKVGGGMTRNFAPGLSDDELCRIRLKLDASGVRLLTYDAGRLPGDEAACRSIFEFGRKIGAETLVAEPQIDSLPLLQTLCDRYDVGLAMRTCHADGAAGRPDDLLKTCHGRSDRIGVCADVGAWMRAGIDPIEGVRTLGHRILVLHVADLDESSPAGRDVPWGTAAGRTETLLRAVHRLGIRPTMFGLEYDCRGDDAIGQLARCTEFFGKISLTLAK